ncbi:MAG: TIGR00730 family Rossman fold protein [Candidatus Kapaibacterium sp.]
MTKPKKEEDLGNLILPRAHKAYDNREFLHSTDGRTIRILAEYLYPEQHFRKREIDKFIVFYGSARTLSRKEYEAKTRLLEHNISKKSGEENVKIKRELEIHRSQSDMTEYYEGCVSLARMLAEWSGTLPTSEQFHICTGGGPGMMEAANKGAGMAGMPSVGLNISLPFEQRPNPYITPDLNFEFHYFFMRKFWFAYFSKAVIAMPGGFGTLDEVMELLTLKQTLKITKPMPILFYGEEFWRTLINFEFLAEKGVISPVDLELFKFKSTPEEAFDYLKGQLSELYNL